MAMLVTLAALRIRLRNPETAACWVSDTVPSTPLFLGGMNAPIPIPCMTMPATAIRTLESGPSVDSVSVPAVGYEHPTDREVPPAVPVGHSTGYRTDYRDCEIAERGDQSNLTRPRT